MEMVQGAKGRGKKVLCTVCHLSSGLKEEEKEVPARGAHSRKLKSSA